MRSGRWGLVIVVGLALLFYLALAPRFAARLDPLTGDEPFYVMTAISIARDHDLDEQNNYANRDYNELYPSDPLPTDWRGWVGFPRTLPPHAAHSTLAGLHTKHGLGLSILIAVPYALAGRAGAMAVIVVMGALLAGQMFLLACEAGARQRVARAIALGLAVVLPIAPYALLIFPEVPAALALTYAIRRLSSAQNNGSQWLLTGIAVGFLPWLHQRFAPTAAVLGVVILWRLWRSRDPIVAAAGVPVAVGAASLIAYNLWLYQSPVQNIADHAGFSPPLGIVNGLFGLLLDAQWGLLINAPIYLVAIVAFPRWLHVDRQRAILAMAAVVPYLAMVGAYRVWWGEWGPAARYLVPIAPLAAGALAALLSRTSSLVRAIAVGTWLTGAALTAVGFANPQRFYHQPNGVNNLIGRVGETVHVDVAGRLVAFQPYALAPWPERVMAGLLLILAMWAVAAITYVLPRRCSGHAPESEPTRLPIR